MNNSEKFKMRLVAPLILTILFSFFSGASAMFESLSVFFIMMCLLCFSIAWLIKRGFEK
jgi:hypothetical protein